MLARLAAVAAALTACGRIGFGERKPSDASPDAVGSALFPLELPDGGSILQLAIAPDGTWYARSGGAGVFRSLDQGVSWTRCVTGPPATGIGVGSDNAVYLAGAPTRISTDGCDSFSELNTMRFSNNIGRSDAYTYALTDQGIERRDSGPWATVATVPGIAFGAFDARGGQIPLLLAGSRDGVYSSDLGGAWTRRATGFATLDIRGVAVGVTKAYAITGAIAGSAGGISCGNADGSVWAPCPAGYGGTAIAVDPTNENHVIAAVYDNLAETTDGFTNMTIGRREMGGMPNAIVTDIDFTPAGDLVLSSVRGVFVAPAGTVPLQARNAGLYAWTPTRLVVDGDDMFVATDAGLARSLGGAPFAIDTPGIAQDVDFKDVVIAPNGDIFGTGRGVWRSADRGATWTSLYSLPPEDEYHAYSIELGANGRIYAGTPRRLVLSDPPYTSWTEVRILDAMAVRPDDLRVHAGSLWAATSMGLYVAPIAPDISADVATFARVSQVEGAVTSIAALADGGLLVGTSTSVWTSDETRTLWTKRMTRSTRTVFVDGDVVLAATSVGVFASRDRGASWTLVPESDGLGTAGLAIDPGSRELIFGASGRGLVRAAIP